MSQDKIKIQIFHLTYGNVVPECAQSMMNVIAFAANRMLTNKEPRIEVQYSGLNGDALVERSRSRGLSALLEDSDADVQIQVDHDIEFRPEDLFGVCIKALETRGLVGGIYALRKRGVGWATRFADSVTTWKMGEDRLLPATYLATGFLAIPRSVAQLMVDELVPRKPLEPGMPKRLCDDPALVLTRCKDSPDFHERGHTHFWDFFRCMPVPLKDFPGEVEFLSEDWAFNYRAAALGIPVHAWAKPVLVHHGMCGFTQADGMDDAQRAAVKIQQERDAAPRIVTP